jgi:quercetin dioxygenase-like cupin family protein
MKARLRWLVVAGVACLAVGAAWAAKKEITTVPPEDLKWMDVPESGGVQVANVSGDIMKGKYSAFAKIPGGQVHPLHTHSTEVKTVVISGTFVIGPEGGPEKSLGPGSYAMIPAGMKHTSSCAPGPACVLFQEGPGKFDMKPVKPPAEKK